MAPDQALAAEQVVAPPVAAMAPAVEQTQQEPAVATQEAPLKAVIAAGDTEQQDSSPKRPEAPAPVVAEATAHPASLGRIGNDPRDNPAKQRQSTVLQPGVAKSAAPSPLASSRTVAESHPSLVGRIANDPRSANRPSDED